MSNPSNPASVGVPNKPPVAPRSEPPGPNGISLGQHAALKVILAGGGMRTAAEAGGVHRGTLHRWVKEDDCFRRALEWEQERARAGARREMISLVEDAASVVRNAVRCGDLHAALSVLRNMGLLSRLESAEGELPAEIVEAPDEEE